MYGSLFNTEHKHKHLEISPSWISHSWFSRVHNLTEFLLSHTWRHAQEAARVESSPVTSRESDSRCSFSDDRMLDASSGVVVDVN